MQETKITGGKLALASSTVKSSSIRTSLTAAALCASTLLMSATTALAADLPEDWQDRINLGVKAYDRGENKVAFDVFYKLMLEGNKTFGPSDGRMLRILVNMGAIYDEEKQYSYAEDCLKRGLNIAQKGYGATSLESVPALIDLAQCYIHEGKDSLAKPLLDKAIAIVNKPNRDDLIPYQAVAEANLGAMFFAQGNYGFGEPHFKRALDLAQKSLGASHNWTTTIGGMYAQCLKAGGKKAEAKDVQRAAVAKANESTSRFGVWAKQVEVADAAFANKNYTEAETAIKLAAQASQELIAEPMLQVITLTKYGDILLAQDKPAIAVEKWKAAQDLADSNLGLEDKNVLVHAKKLADLEKTQSQYREAEPLYLRLIADAKKQYGADSDQYAAATVDAADNYSRAARYPDAAKYYVKYLAYQEKKFGPNSENLVPTLVALGTNIQNNTTYLTELNVKAEDYFKRAEDIATKKFGPNSKQVVEIWDALSRYYQRRIEWDKAIKFSNQIIAADEKSFGPTSDETVKSMERHAILLRAAGERNEAEVIEAKIAKIKRGKAPAEAD